MSVLPLAKVQQADFTLKLSLFTAFEAGGDSLTVDYTNNAT